VVRNLEVEFLGKTFLSPLEQFHLFFYVISIINYPSTVCAYQVMMMSGAFRPAGEFVSSSAITEIKFGGQSRPNKQFQSAVNGSESNVGVNLVDFKIHILSTKMIRCLAQYVQNSVPRCSEPVTMTLKAFVPPVLPVSRTARHTITPLKNDSQYQLKMISNIKYIIPKQSLSVKDFSAPGDKAAREGISLLAA
jgi:hypothetical protein